MAAAAAALCWGTEAIVACPDSELFVRLCAVVVLLAAPPENNGI